MPGHFLDLIPAPQLNQRSGQSTSYAFYHCWFSIHSTSIGGHRGSKGAICSPPQDVKKSPFCLAYAARYKICAIKLTNFILNIRIFRRFSCSKSVCFRGCALATGPCPRSPPPLSAFGSIFFALGASLPFLTSISGYAYVR